MADMTPETMSPEERAECEAVEIAMRSTNATGADRLELIMRLVCTASRRATALEREACAETAEDCRHADTVIIGDIAAAIRSRGNGE